MLDRSTTAQVTAAFAAIVHPVRVVRYLDDSPHAAELAELLDQLASCSPLLSVVDAEAPSDARVPSCVVERLEDPEVSVAFAGAPLGHELSSLVLAILHVSGHPPRVDPALLEVIAAVEQDLVFETYYARSCQNCPDVVQALNVTATQNRSIRHVAIDGGAFPDEVAARSVTAVPTVYCNGELFLQGRSDLAAILAKVAPDTHAKAAAAIDRLEPFDVVVVGGGPAGCAAAVYAARKGVKVAIVAERMGGQVQDTDGIENLVSVLRTSGPSLASDLAAHVAANDVTVLAGHRATELAPAADVGGHHTVMLANGATVRARAVVLAPGASWRALDVPGAERLRNRGVTFCPHCDGPLFKGRPVCVVGGGNSGVEAAIDLAGLASHVTVIEYGSELRADAVLLRSLDDLDNVAVITSATTIEITGDARVDGLVYLDRADDTEHRIDVDGVFVQIGLDPATEWLAGVVDRSPRGEILVDDHGRTSCPGVFAAGDATTTPFKQIVVALGAGATAALSAFDHLVRTRTTTASSTPA